MLIIQEVVVKFENMKLVEKITKYSNVLIGLKHVSGSEPFVTGHYPDYVIYPGVMSLELILELLREKYGKFLEGYKIKRLQYVSQISPGDVLEIRIETKEIDSVLNEHICSISSIGADSSELKVKATILINQ